jgi:hypothetical protein
MNVIVCCVVPLVLLVVIILALALPRKLYDSFLLDHVTEFMERTGAKLLPKAPVGAEAILAKTSIWGADTRTSYLPLRMDIGGRFMTGFIFESRPVKEDYAIEQEDHSYDDQKDSPFADLIAQIIGVCFLWVLYHTILRPRRYHICYVPAGIENGSMLVKPEGVLDKIRSGMGFKDVSVGEKDFDSKFLISASPAPFPKTFFTPEMRKHFKKKVDFNVLVRDGDLLIWKQAGSSIPSLWFSWLGRNRGYLVWLQNVQPVISKMLKIYENQGVPVEDAVAVGEQN